MGTAEEAKNQAKQQGKRNNNGNIKSQKNENGGKNKTKNHFFFLFEMEVRGY